MTLQVNITCPLGSNCERVIDGAIERCAWYVKLEGEHPQSGEKMNESRCAMAWIPVLQIEGNGQNRHITTAVQSLRNETIKRQNAALEMVKNAQISQDS